ncbi:protein phosphatase 2C domain-containing protein, partial [Roseiflexus sp.]|uniref:PP2C family protein-serine/threonine phosphatase n=1 Tax=Roseiflexus sp. TaxID=2562120 RepID=UPI00398AF8B9
MPAHAIPIPFDEGMISHRGRVRTLNEDSFGSFRSVTGLSSADEADLLRRKGYLYVVADGMGGHDCGDLASATAVQNICASYYADPDDDPMASLRRAIEQANKAIYDTAQARRVVPGSTQGRMRPMGTTVTCAVILDDRLVLAHVGDSRAYRLRGGVLSCLTTDHDWISDQMRLYGISREEAEKRAAARGARGALMRAVGVQTEVQPDILMLDWQEDDILLLCSDGLHGLVGDAAIGQMLASHPAPLAARALVDAANVAGGHDNITAVIVRGATKRVPAMVRPHWQRWMLVSAMIGACLLVALGLATRVASGQSLVIANNVLEFAGLPTLPPTVALLPTSMPTATMSPSPTATATASATSIVVANPQATRLPTISRPTRSSAPARPDATLPTLPTQENTPEITTVLPELSRPIVLQTPGTLPSAPPTPIGPPRQPEQPAPPDDPLPSDAGKLPASPTAAPTAPPTVPPTAAPTAPPTVPPTAAPTAPPTVPPTAAPTAPPTVPPTAAPTAPPTVPPTAAPTAPPTVPPTAAPT